MTRIGGPSIGASGTPSRSTMSRGVISGGRGMAPRSGSTPMIAGRLRPGGRKRERNGGSCDDSSLPSARPAVRRAGRRRPPRRASAPPALRSGRRATRQRRLRQRRHGCGGQRLRRLDDHRAHAVVSPPDRFFVHPARAERGVEHRAGRPDPIDAPRGGWAGRGARCRAVTITFSSNSLSGHSMCRPAATPRRPAARPRLPG